MEKSRMKKKSKLIPASRKTAKATAVITTGTGKVFINKTPVEIITPLMARERMLTPLEIIGDHRNKVDINIRVSGGGYMGQAEACAIAMSRAIISHIKAKEVKTKISDYDQHLLSGDSRRSESKKFGGPGARRRKQKSYR
uniref:30S ribosomal protein S9 n=1 Tax=uncultured marine thaumarchaeote AD1000_17_C04 TaxID=1455895 RepID=A0A075FR25_9ARCH|nr:ribosomal protein S9 (RP-S9, rpsI) [uncultured marine thaumarchaeote AD1000_17_C04]